MLGAVLEAFIPIGLAIGVLAFWRIRKRAGKGVGRKGR